MKILYYKNIGNQLLNRWTLYHFVPYLKKYHDYSHFNIYNIHPNFNINSKNSLEIIDEELMKYIKKNHKKWDYFDLFFTYSYDKELLPKTLKKIWELWIKTVNFSCDNIEKPYHNIKNAKYYDACRITEPEAYKNYKKYWANPIVLPMAANPDFYKPYKTKNIYDTSFCGQKYGSRVKYIDELLKNEIDVNIWWYGWGKETKKRRNRNNTIIYNINHIIRSLKYPQSRTMLYADILKVLENKKYSFPPKNIHAMPEYEELVKLFSQSKISLGFNERWNSYLFKTPLYQIRLRDFEAPMSGACYIMHREKEMLNYYKEDEEMIFYETEKELIDKIKFYTKKDYLISEIKKKARIRSVEQHTRKNRFEDLFKELNIKT